MWGQPRFIHRQRGRPGYFRHGGHVPAVNAMCLAGVRIDRLKVLLPKDKEGARVDAGGWRDSFWDLVRGIISSDLNSIPAQQQLILSALNFRDSLFIL